MENNDLLNGLQYDLLYATLEKMIRKVKPAMSADDLNSVDLLIKNVILKIYDIQTYINKLRYIQGLNDNSYLNMWNS